jgi:hypothetical protein
VLFFISTIITTSRFTMRRASFITVVLLLAGATLFVLSPYSRLATSRARHSVANQAQLYQSIDENDAKWRNILAFERIQHIEPIESNEQHITQRAYSKKALVTFQSGHKAIMKMITRTELEPVIVVDHDRYWQKHESIDESAAD